MNINDTQATGWVFGGVGYSGCEREHADHCIARDSTDTEKRTQPLPPGKEPMLSLISDWGIITNCPSVVSQLREKTRKFTLQ